VSVTLLNDRVHAYDFAIKPLEYRNGFATVDMGRFACALSFNFLRSPPTGDITKCQSSKNDKT